MRMEEIRLKFNLLLEITIENLQMIIWLLLSIIIDAKRDNSKESNFFSENYSNETKIANSRRIISWWKSIYPSIWLNAVKTLHSFYVKMSIKVK